MTKLPRELHTAAQVRTLDRLASERLGIATYELMKRAGAGALAVLQKRWPGATRIIVVCGPGNNGGDGYVVAKLALLARMSVIVIAAANDDPLRGDALLAFEEYRSAGGRVEQWSDTVLRNADVIVDALFGTGLSRPLDAARCAQIQAINEADTPVLALDIPSGLDADTGRVLGAAVVADCTIAFVGLKIGFYLGTAPDYIGILEFDPLGIPDSLTVASVAERIDAGWLKSILSRRSKLAHKGSTSRVLVVGGGIGMAGAARLTGEACLRVGAGLVTVAAHPASVAAIVTERPELIVRGVATGQELSELLARAEVVVIGPGLGQDAWALNLLDVALEAGKSIVVDADALNLLAKAPRSSPHWILTPHPGEAGRMLDATTEAVQADRLGSVQALASKFGGVSILKGANTLIARQDEIPFICDRGNSAMATPGMGDVLAGVIAGLLAQFDDPWTAARAGVVAHAVAGDLAAIRLGGIDRGLIASDLFAELPKVVSPEVTID